MDNHSEIFSPTLSLGLQYWEVEGEEKDQEINRNWWVLDTVNFCLYPQAEYFRLGSIMEILEELGEPQS